MKKSIKMKINNLFALGLFSLFLVSCSKSPKELVLEAKNGNIEDALICKFLPYQNFSEEENIHLYSSKQGDSINVNRVVLSFKEIPANIKIDSAFLQLKFNAKSVIGKDSYGENGFIIQRIISPWDETEVNWANSPVTTDHNQIFTDKTKLKKDPNRINVTRLVQDISDDKDNSYGFLLKLINENSSSLVLLASSNNSEASLRPKLKIYYSDKQ
ncbi:DNRLRE domain-containing protein [Flavobacterium yafengii]|uniref:DNRLRE domain-containing protein n=1 Tax=Flavobacterium yafengii TaxID=3041253 RepID=UPI0024A9F451|nr:DNRLRE domain-containing protein [Flavobacterium yafengii]MDI6045548.1 DNRLRE domain-containing protein [Flavobacterium yafengii]